MSEEVYKQQILNRYHNPKYKGQLAQPTIEVSLANPLCGDKIQWQINIQDELIQDLAWQGEGCAISLVAADLLAEKVSHMSPDQVVQITNQDMIKQLDIELKPSREKCATLALDCLKKGLLK